MNNLEIFSFDSIDSTNNFLLGTPYNGKTQLCIAKQQTSGRGQYGRVWQNQAQNALFSLKIKLAPTLDISGLSLVVGLAIVDVLEHTYHLQNLQIKWPNDIFRDGKKIGGILIENSIKGRESFLVIGVGINIMSDEFESMNQNINTEQLTTRLADNILKYIDIFMLHTFEHFSTSWKMYDFLVNNAIPIIYQEKNGVSLGVTDAGCLIFSDGTTKEVINSSRHITTIL